MSPSALMRCLAALLLADASGPAAQGIPPVAAAGIDSLFARFTRPGQPGCALGIYQEGRIAYAKGYGLASVELGVPITPATVFDIGSVSKQFTALSVVLLAQDGKLSLDDEIQRFLPELPRYARPVTIRHLLHHTSGIRDYIDLLELSGVQEEAVTGDREALAVLARQRSPNFAAGAEYAYSNSGFFLLSVIVRRASGKSLREFAAERIFGPLGMSHTQFVESHTAVVPGKASSYRATLRNGVQAVPANWEQTGDGAVNTTVEDLRKWDGNFASGQVGGAAAIRELETVGVLNDGTKITYALGQGVDTWRGVRRISHGGSWQGFRAQLTRFPEQRTTIACLCNVANAGPSLLADRVAEGLLAGKLSAAPAPAEGPGAPVRPAKLSRALAEYAGRYHSDELLADWEVVVVSDTLHVRVGPLVDEPLTPMSDGSFAGLAPIRFVESNGKISGLTITTRGVRNFLLTRMENRP